MDPLQAKHEKDITIDLLRSLIRCDFDCGSLFWLPRDRSFFKTDLSFSSWNTRYSGKEAFTSQSKGYRLGTILRVQIPAHRIVFALAHGYWPNGQIDHINGRKNDNRIENLRDVSSLENHRNLRLRKTNTTGFTGVVWDKTREKWFARVSLNGRMQNIGRFSCLGHAIDARKNANIKYGFHKNHGSIAS